MHDRAVFHAMSVPDKLPLCCRGMNQHHIHPPFASQPEGLSGAHGRDLHAKAAEQPDQASWRRAD